MADRPQQTGGGPDQSRDRVREPDTLLGSQVAFLNSVGEDDERSLIAGKITLMVGGTLITGYIIPEWRWAEQSGNSFAEDMRDFTFEHRKDHVRPQFIHLIHAHAWTGATRMPDHDDGNLFRIRLSEVQGWSTEPISGLPDALSDAAERLGAQDEDESGDLN